MPANINKMVNSAAIFTFGNFLSRALGIISMPIMTRYLSPHEYGILSISNIIIGILSLLFSLGASSFIMRYYYDFDSYEGKRALFGTILIFLILSGLALSLILTFCGRNIFKIIFKDIQFYPYFVIAIWISFLSILSIIPDVLFLIKQKALLYSGLNLIKAIVGLGITLYLVIIWDKGALGPLISNLIVYFVFGVSLLYYYRNEFAMHIRVNLIKECVSFSTPVLIVMLSKVVSNNMEMLIIQKYIDVSASGIYSIAIAAGSILGMVAIAFDLAWGPFYYSVAKESEMNADKNILGKVAKMAIFAFLSVGLGIIIFRQEIIKILTPPEYFEAIKIVPLIVIGVILNCLIFIPIRGIYYQKKTKAILGVTMLTLAMSLGLNLILTPRYGIYGAATASLLGNIFALIMIFALAQKYYPIKYEYKKNVKLGLIFLIFISLSIFDNRNISLFNISIRSIMFTSFFLAIYLFRCFDKDEMNWLIGMMRGHLKK